MPCQSCLDTSPYRPKIGPSLGGCPSRNCSELQALRLCTKRRGTLTSYTTLPGPSYAYFHGLQPPHFQLFGHSRIKRNSDVSQILENLDFSIFWPFQKKVPKTAFLAQDFLQRKHQCEAFKNESPLKRFQKSRVFCKNFNGESPQTYTKF